MCSADCFLAFLAVLFPPVAVWVKRGICSADSLINIALCCLGYLPGLLHAWYIVCKYPEEPFYQPIDGESSYSRVYYFGPQGGVSHSSTPRPGPRAHTHSPAPPPRHPGYGNPGYGAFQPQPQYPSNTQSPAPGGQPPHTPGKYANYQQQTPGEGSSNGNGSSGEQGELPSYSDVVKGDYKVQTHD